MKPNLNFARWVVLCFLGGSPLARAVDTETGPGLNRLGLDEPAVAVAAAVAGERFVFGISPFLEDAAKDEVFRALVQFLLEDMPLGSSMQVCDAYRLQTVAQVAIPERRVFASGRTRLTQFRDPIRRIRDFLATRVEPPQVGGQSFTQAVRLPQFLEFAVGNPGMGMGAAGEKAAGRVNVMAIGSPLYLDEKEPSFSMADGYFPSDGHLLATRDRSVYGVGDRTNALQGVQVSLGYFGDPWVTEVQRERVGRFWRLMVGRQGGRWGGMSGDLATVFAALRDRGTAEGRKESSDGVLRPSEVKLEMLRVTRSVAQTDWITQDLPSDHQEAVPRVTRGPLKIGIRWRGAMDLDLYARGSAGGPILSFENTRCPGGYYYRDHRTSPDREYEFIEFVEPVEVTEVEASINFYEGRAPGGVTGEVRVEFGGRIYTRPFTVASETGNRGRGGTDQARYWAPIDVARVLGMARADRGGAGGAP